MFQKFEEFLLDRWRSYASAVSLSDLQSLSTDPNLELLNAETKLTYGTHEGSVRLRQRIAELHSSEDVKFTADDVLITPGSIMANFLVLGSICGAGDHIICQYPTFGPLYLIPQYGGVDVDMWRMNPGKYWSLRLDELAGLIKPNTKAIIINNPNNPTGLALPKEFLQQVVEIARKSDITVFTDEVFAPLFFSEPHPPTFVSLGYRKSVVTSSLSKSFAIPGIRIGWIISQDKELMNRISNTRDYTTISVSLLDDAVASYALNEAVMPNLMKRNIALCKKSVGLLEELIGRNPERLRWSKPAGAGTAFVQVLHKDGTAVDDVAFCQALTEKVGVGVSPGGWTFGNGNADDFKGFVRITLGNPEILRESLPLFEQFVQSY